MIPMGALGVRMIEPPPAAAVVTTVSTPVAGVIAMEVTFRVAPGALYPMLYPAASAAGLPDAKMSETLTFAADAPTKPSLTRARTV